MRFIQRTVALVLLVALGAWLFYIGREHQVFLDNKTLEYEGKTYKALKMVKVTPANGSAIELLPRDRDVVKVVNPSLSLKIEVMDEFGETVEKVFDLNLKLGFTKDIMLSLPLLASGQAEYILPPPTTQPQNGEEVPLNPESGEQQKGIEEIPNKH